LKFRVGKALTWGAASALLVLTVTPIGAAHAASSSAGVTGTVSAAAGSEYLKPLKAGTPKIIADSSAYAAASESPGWMKTPEGFQNTSCVHRLPAGARVEDGGAESYFVLKSGARQALPQCAYARIVQPQSSTSMTKNLASGSSGAATNWYYDTWWNAPSWLSQLKADYEVPAPPTQSGATIYMFSSFMSSDLSTIIQPVLQYGSNGEFGGNYWTIAPWYVYDDNTASVVGAPETVSQGDTIYGQMTATGCNSAGHCTWTITIEDNSNTSIPSSTAVVESAIDYTSAQAGVLEIYHAVGCIELPHSDHAVFRDVYTYSGSGHTLNTDPQWVIQAPNQQCGMYGSDTLDSTDFYWSGS
jgi:hypothetical protein